jgi:hypothetical protein
MAIAPPELIQALNEDAQELGKMLDGLPPSDLVHGLRKLTDDTRKAIDVVGFSLPQDYADAFACTHILVRRSIRSMTDRAAMEN